MKFNLQWTIIHNDYGIVIAIITKIPSYTNQFWYETSSLEYIIFRNVKNLQNYCLHMPKFSNKIDKRKPVWQSTVLTILLHSLPLSFSGSQHHDCVFLIASGNAIETQYTIFFVYLFPPCLIWGDHSMWFSTPGSMGSWWISGQLVTAIQDEGDGWYLMKDITNSYPVCSGLHRTHITVLDCGVF
jgi:hypothetical protein